MDAVETATRARAARRASQRPQVQHLITADENSLGELEIALAALPLCAVGRVFIEVPETSDIGAVQAPPRMTITWLARSHRAGSPGSARGCRAGEALSRAAIAWADEMLCDESDAGLPTEVTLLGGYLSTADIVDHLMQGNRLASTAIHAPARYGLPVC